MDIIVVDDVALMRKILIDILVGHCGIDRAAIHEASDGIAAVRDYKRYKPQVVFLDVLMPDQDGIETVSEMIKFDPNAYIIMVSSAKDKATVEKCVKAGAKDYIIKPLDASRLQLSVQNSGYKPKGV